MEAHGSWLTVPQLLRAGHGDLVSAIYRRGGGLQAWARRLGYETLRASWSEALIESELREFAAGRADWPPRHEFEATGRSKLF